MELAKPAKQTRIAPKIAPGWLRPARGKMNLSLTPAGNAATACKKPAPPARTQPATLAKKIAPAKAKP